MTKTDLQKCYDFHIIEGLPLDKKLVTNMARALDVAVIFTPEDPSWKDHYDPMNMQVHLYQVKGSDLKMAIGFNGHNWHACGRLVTPLYLEHVKKVHAVHVDGKYFDMMIHDFGFCAALLMAWMHPPDGIAMCQCDEC